MARILIVDDDRQFRRMMERLLADRGHEVRECGDGIEIGDALRDWEAELIFLDMIMEKKSGIDALSDLRRSHPGIPVLLVSGSDMDLVRDTFAAAGMVGAAGYLQKPFSAESLYRAVGEALGE